VARKSLAYRGTTVAIGLSIAPRPPWRTELPGERLVNQETPARRLRILCVCSASHWGGNEQWLSLAIAELAKRHEVYLCYGATELASRFGPCIEAFRAPLRGLWDIITIRRLGRFVRERGIELIIATKRTDYVVCGALSRTLGIKNVLRLGITRRLWIPIWHRLVYGYLNDGIIVNAERTRETLLDRLRISPAKVRTIRNGVALRRPRPEPATRAGAQFRITSVGSLIRRKGHRELIQAVALLPSEARAAVELEILGAGREDAHLRALIRRLGLERQVRLRGHQLDPLPYLATSQLFVLLSSNEGISNALLEAMALGIPVLTTRAGGHAEFLRDGDNGYLVENRRPQAVAGKLEAILRDGGREQVGARGYETVCDQFRLEAMGAELERFLLEVVSPLG
jgi:glycosyltransferase involved in cell wall biosynthesis